MTQIAYNVGDRVMHRDRQEFGTVIERPPNNTLNPAIFVEWDVSGIVDEPARVLIPVHETGHVGE